jgi:hypothetical protein
MQSHARYMLVTIFAPLGFFLLCFLFPMTSYYMKISGYFWDPVVEQRFLLMGQKADVIFVGESSLVHGIRPLEVAKVSGLSGENLGVPVDSMVFVPFLALDHYLANNAAPSLIVLNLTPWTAPLTLASKSCEAGTPWYTSAVMILRHGSFKEFANFFLKCPDKLLHFPIVIAKQITSFNPSGAGYTRIIGLMNSEAGYYPLDRDNPQAFHDEVCEDYAPSKSFLTLVQQFKQSYTRPGTKAIFYLNPAPSQICDLNKLRKTFGAISDNVPYTLDDRYFVNLRHLGDQGALMNSRIVGEFLKTYE